MDVRFRPLDRSRWPGTPTHVIDRSFEFRASWSDTLDLLQRELDHLRARNIVIEAAFRESDLRIDGWPRADARTPDDPGVIVSFDSIHGPLRYACDRFAGGQYRTQGKLPGWQCNVRAIALGLEALRKVERYGIATRAEQYRGWNALPSGIAMAEFTPRSAAGFLADHAGGGWDTEHIETAPGTVDKLAAERAYKTAVKTHHPDVGGDHDTFVRLQRAYDTLIGS